MLLPLLRRTFLGAGLALCLSCPTARALQTVAPAADGANDPTSPVPVPVGDGKNAPVTPPTTDANATTNNATTATATVQRKTLTPEERRQQTEEKLRALMINLGVTAAATQDAIIAYLAEDEMAHASLRDAEKRLLTGLRRDVPPERMRDLLSDYRAAIDSEKLGRTILQRKLDARVGYSLDPKLETVLWLMGVLGDGAAKLSTSALALPRNVEAPAPGADKPGAPIYGPPLSPNFGARGEIVGTVTAKGVSDAGEHWLEIRDDSGALERYAALWREDLGALDPEVEKQLTQTPLSARVRVQWVWQERRRALSLQPENATPEAPARPVP